MTFILSVFLALISSSHAQEAIYGDTDITRTIAAAVAHANADFTGAGERVTLTYSAESPFVVYVLFLEKGGTFAMGDALSMHAESGERRSLTLDLTRSPGWKSGTRTYRFHFLSQSTAAPVFHGITFAKTPLWRYPIIATKQLMRSEDAVPSVYHRLQGRRILGFPLTVFAGVTLLALSIGTWKTRRDTSAVVYAITAMLLVSSLTSLDLLRYQRHVRDWLSTGTFGSAGALHRAAAAATSDGATSIALCTDDSSYSAVILSYAAYPVEVTGSNPSHIVLHRAARLNLDGGMLRCGDISLRAEHLLDIDGSTSIYRHIP